ncbi:MAG: ABC transporter permease [Anaerovoracaceae bacterium]
MLSLDIMALFRALPASVAQGMLWGIMAIGVFITFKILDFADLTVDGSLALGGAVAVMLIRGGVNPATAICIATLTGLVAGFITGILNTVLGIPDILAGILTQIALYSVNLTIMGKANQAVSVDKYGLIVSLRYIPHTMIVALCFLAVIVAVLYWFFGTELGFTIRATGTNQAMARAQGINTNVAKVLALSLSNALVAMSGSLIAQYQGSADVNMGRGAIVIGLAAVIIGEVIGESLLGKHMNFALKLVFAAIGAIIYYIVIAFVLWLGLPSDFMKLFSAIVVAIFLAVPYLKGKYNTSFAKAAKISRREAAEAGEGDAQ